VKDIIKIWPFVKPYTGKIFVVLIFNLLTSLFSLFSFTVFIPFLSILFESQQIVHEPVAMEFSTESIKHNAYYLISYIVIAKGKLYALYAVCAMFVFMIFLKNLAAFLSGYFLAPITNGMPRDIYQLTYEKIINLPPSYFTERRKGDIMSRMSSDITNMQLTLMSSLTGLIKYPITILVFASTLFMISYEMTLFIIMVMPVVAIITGKIGGALKHGAHKSQSQSASMMVTIEETLTGLRIIKAFGAARHQINKFAGQNHVLYKLQNRLSRRYFAAHPLSEMMGISVLAMAMAFGGNLVLSGQGLSAEGFIYYLVVFSQVISPAKGFSTSFYNIKKSSASIDRIAEILSAENTITDKPGAANFSRFSQEIEFCSVCFEYEEGRPVLIDIDFKLQKGKTIALVGQSGSGKTTIANLLPRFYDITSGSIKIDGADIRDVKLEDLRKQMGIVSQESILFNDTIFNNIAFGMDSAQMQDVQEAAKIANAHDFIMEIPGGYSATIGDGGSKLSGGQRQRISIARAVLKNPPLLVLDEATSALDTESEKHVQQALDRLMSNRTSLVIAHRLSTIKKADEILVMSEGQIIERGTHDQLVGKNGQYAKLHALQLL
jgi:ATP-binding cassette, subfamily B, bacterial MsbA